MSEDSLLPHHPKRSGRYHCWLPIKLQRTLKEGLITTQPLWTCSELQSYTAKQQTHNQRAVVRRDQCLSASNPRTNNTLVDATILYTQRCLLHIDAACALSAGSCLQAAYRRYRAAARFSRLRSAVRACQHIARNYMVLRRLRQHVWPLLRRLASSGAADDATLAMLSLTQRAAPWSRAPFGSSSFMTQNDAAVPG